MGFWREIIKQRLSIFLCMAILALICWLTLHTQQAVYSDFIGYWSAAKVFLNGGNPYASSELYKIQHSLGRTKSALEFWNPPWAFCLFLPFSILNFWTARIVWVCFEAILLLKSVHWLWRAMGGRQSEWLIAFLAMVLYVPTIQTLLFAQVTPFVLIGLIGFIWALERKNCFLAGLFTILIAAKPHIAYAFWILLLCYCIRNRKIKLFCSVSIFLVTPVLLLFLYNPQILFGIADAVRGLHQFEWMTATLGFSLRVAFGLDHIWVQVLPTVLGALYVIIFWDYSESMSWSSNLAPILLLSTISTTYLWPHDCVILLPAVIQMLIWFHASPHSRWWLLSLLIGVNILEPLVPPWRCIYLAWWCPASIALIYVIALRANFASSAEVRD